MRRALRKLGADIQDALRRRRLSMAVVVERAFTSWSTLQKIEAGEAASPVRLTPRSWGRSQVADIANDSVGQALASADLLKSVHLKRPAGSFRDG